MHIVHLNEAGNRQLAVRPVLPEPGVRDEAYVQYDVPATRGNLTAREALGFGLSFVTGAVQAEPDLAQLIAALLLPVSTPEAQP